MGFCAVTGFPSLVVAIGASAGGLAAFTKFLANMPDDSGMGFVLLQHMEAGRESLLDQLLRGHTSMHVVIASDGMRVLPNHVYVVPAGVHATLKGGAIRLAAPKDGEAFPLLLDGFFVSLAADQGARAACIVLSGTGSDGSLGLRAVREQGGLVLAQANVGADGFSGMPDHALETGFLDALLPVQDMPAFLEKYARHLREQPPAEGGTDSDFAAMDLVAKVLTRLESQTGHDFSGYKPGMVTRRIQRRMALLQLPQAEDYLARLAEDPAESQYLLRDFLIRVTYFFRDPAAFAALRALLPPLLEGCDAENPFRIWVPACATGEEVYSMAAMLSEIVMERGSPARLQVFGTDVDASAINVARAARYSQDAAAGLPPEILRRWFVERDGFVEPKRPLREMCIFSPHNVIRDPPFCHMHLISCRNLMIYFKPELQDHILQTFHFALRSNGLLFLGMSEAAGRTAALFVPADKKYGIYRHSGLPTPPLLRARLHGQAPERILANVPHENWLYRAAQRLAAQYTPAYLVVDASHQIVRFSGGAILDFLEPSPGPATLYLFDLLRPSLQASVRQALSEASLSGHCAIVLAVDVEGGGEPRDLDVIAEPLAVPLSGPAANDLSPNFFVIIFNRRYLSAAERDGVALADGDSAQRRILTGIAQIESLNEDLRLAVDDHRAMNEELRSANEELEASREEMQSVIEELQTLNAELNEKNQSLAILNDDFRNLLDSTQIATLFLNRDRLVKTFTANMAELISLRPIDIGRPVTDLSSRIDYATLEADFAEVIATSRVLEREVRTKADPPSVFLMRMRRYQRANGEDDGVVLTFVDITQVKNAEEKMTFLAHHDLLTGLPNRAMFHAQLERAAAVAAGADFPSALIFLDLDRFKQVNDAFGHRTGDRLLQMVGTRLRGCVRSGDSVFRLGGDEFAIVEWQSPQRRDISGLADRIIQEISRPFDIDGHQMRVGISIGISFLDPVSPDCDLVVRQADMALYDAKERSGSNWQIFTAEMQNGQLERHRVEQDLDAALAAGELLLHYQPIVRLSDRRIVGAEALLRWQHKELGLLLPDAFIPIAEASGQIVALGAWVLQQSFRDAVAWPEPIRISVNLSPVQFARGDIATIVRSALAESGLPASRVALEVTETVLLKDSPATQANLLELRRGGIAISMDDFGTGFSSLSNLRRFPIDEIKIDQSFIAAFELQPQAEVIVKAIADIGQGLKMFVCAEGVQSKAQCAALQTLGVELAQGNGLHAPMTTADLTQLLEAQQTG